MSYYLDATPEKFRDGWLRMGDMGVLDSLGYLRITDRTKDVIKSGGEWVASIDLENAIMAHPLALEVGARSSRRLRARCEVGRAAVWPLKDQTRMIAVPLYLEPMLVDVAVMEFTKRAEVRELMRATIGAFFNVVNIGPACEAVTSREPARLIPHHHRATVACRNL